MILWLTRKGKHDEYPDRRRPVAATGAVEEAVLSLGHEAIGTATTAKEAYELADKAEVAFVDVNLIDGATGPEIGRRLAADGVTVVFMPGNPEQLDSGVGGALGVINR
ncbi:hypothetical protein DEA98_28765 (plasmid) [Brucella pseudogrignonensis]|nr:hypothetical protein [Brucella pseudogrignonensis]